MTATPEYIFSMTTS